MIFQKKKVYNSPCYHNSITSFVPSETSDRKNKRHSIRHNVMSRNFFNYNCRHYNPSNQPSMVTSIYLSGDFTLVSQIASITHINKSEHVYLITISASSSSFIFFFCD